MFFYYIFHLYFLLFIQSNIHLFIYLIIIIYFYINPYNFTCMLTPLHPKFLTG